jgi:hypothetical protein
MTGNQLFWLHRADSWLSLILTATDRGDGVEVVQRLRSFDDAVLEVCR